MDTTTSLLIHARHLILRPNAWTQDHMALAPTTGKLADGTPYESWHVVASDDPEAKRWCMLGAVECAAVRVNATEAEKIEALELLAEKAEGYTHDDEPELRHIEASHRIEQFNDYDHREHDDVLSVFNETLFDAGVDMPPTPW